MRVAVIGSRTLHIENLKDYLPDGTTEIVSGGAKGVDADAKEYATQNQIPITEFLPDYQRYGRGAPLKRNIQIIDYADIVLAVWDGKSRGTKFVIDQCKKKNITKLHRAFLWYGWTGTWTATGGLCSQGIV